MNLVHSQIMVQLIRHGIIHDNHGKMPIVIKSNEFFAKLVHMPLPTGVSSETSFPMTVFATVISKKRADLIAKIKGKRDEYFCEQICSLFYTYLSPQNIVYLVIYIQLSCVKGGYWAHCVIDLRAKN